MTIRPIAHLGGARPPAPDWFKAAMALAPERRFLTVDGADIEMLCWGARGDPGILLVHGFGAHADWWTYLAPLLLPGRRIAAFSFSGMGGSGWRGDYCLAQHAREAMAVAEAAGLFDAALGPVIIGHSFGSFVTRLLAQQHGGRLGGTVLIDGAVPAEEEEREFGGPRGRRHQVYATLAEALARFRFAPPQTCENLYIVDHIARTSLGPARDQQGREGWTWRFDPDLHAKMDTVPPEALMTPAARPVALLFGARSLLMTRGRLARLRRLTPPDVPWIEIPDAGHHVLADQPLALMAALRTLLAVWQPTATLGHETALEAFAQDKLSVEW